MYTHENFPLHAYFSKRPKKSQLDMLQGPKLSTSGSQTPLLNSFYGIHGMQDDSGILPRTLDIVFGSVDGRGYEQSNFKPAKNSFRFYTYFMLCNHGGASGCKVVF